MPYTADQNARYVRVDGAKHLNPTRALAVCAAAAHRLNLTEDAATRMPPRPNAPRDAIIPACARPDIQNPGIHARRAWTAITTWLV